MTDTAQAVANIGYFAVGFEPVDAIHREFHDVLVDLQAPGDEGEKLVALHEHLLRHCAQEEQWMRASDFPACACHAREHEMLLEAVAEVRRRYDAGDYEAVVRLAQELPQWFELHASSMDAVLAAYLRDRSDSLPVPPASRAMAGMSLS